MKNTIQGSTLIIIAALLWAFDGIIRRYLFTLPAETIIFYEHLIGTIILLPFAWRYLWQKKLSSKEWGLLFVVSLLSGLLGTLWFTKALFQVNFISFSVVFLLQKLQPIFAITSARIFLKEPLHKNYIIWALLAIAAAYFVTFPGGAVNLATGAGTITAALFALGAAFAWGTSTTFSKILLKERSHTEVTALRFMLTTVIAFLFVVLFGTGFASLSAPTVNQFGLFAVIALSTGMVALAIYYKGLKLTPVRVSTILELTFPLVAIIIDAVQYHSFLSITQWVAAAVLMYSMYRISKLSHASELQLHNTQ